jgi:DNA-binding NtrC family response regulator
MSAGGVLTLGDYLEQRHAPRASAPLADHDDADAHPAHPPGQDLAMELPLRDQVEAFERGVVARVMEATGGNQSEAARRLGVSRVTLIDKLKKYGLTRRSVV